MRRVTRAGGLVVTLDITRLTTPVWSSLFGAYFHHVVPLVGALVARDRAAYTYLPRSVDRFVTAAELAELMGRLGLRDIRYRTFGLGTVALHVGTV
jgi:demethylmenaquinone methyltransferase/2-methoxy-6-polyprenyl-1,4-benzoquinol methylase